MIYSLLLGILLAPAVDTSANWPGFRGDGSSVSTAKELPLKWSPDSGIAWRTSLPGYGQSSPVVWGGKVFITSVEGDEKEKVLIVCLDTQSGKTLWWKSFAASQKGKNNPMMSRAAPTPVVDENGIYALFESGDVIAMTHQGELMWQRSLVKDFGELKNNHGIGSSLAQTDRHLIVQMDHAGPSYLLSLEKQTGKVNWKADRPSRTAWTSPVVSKVQNRQVIAVSCSGSLSVYDADSGKLLSNFDGLVGNTIASPTFHDDCIVIGAGENRMKPDLIASGKSNCLIRLTPNESDLKLETVWQGKKLLSHHASPIVHAGYVYFISKSGIVTCVDLKTGEEQYSERLENQAWATPIACGDRIYFFGKDGITTVIKSGPRFERLSSNRLWSKDDFEKRQKAAREEASEKLPKPPEGKGPGGGAPLPKAELEATRYSAVGDVVYGAAAVEGTIFVRTGSELICIRSSKPTSNNP